MRRIAGWIIVGCGLLGLATAACTSPNPEYLGVPVEDGEDGGAAGASPSLPPAPAESPGQGNKAPAADAGGVAALDAGSLPPPAPPPPPPPPPPPSDPGEPADPGDPAAPSCESWSDWQCTPGLLGCTASCEQAVGSVRQLGCDLLGNCNCELSGVTEETCKLKAGGIWTSPTDPCAVCAKSFAKGCCMP